MRQCCSQGLLITITEINLLQQLRDKQVQLRLGCAGRQTRAVALYSFSNPRFLLLHMSHSELYGGAFYHPLLIHAREGKEVVPVPASHQ